MWYKLIKLGSIAFLEKCKQEISDEFKRSGCEVADDLENIHKYVEYEMINSIRMKAFERINRLDWKPSIIDMFEKSIIETCGPDFVIQKKLNLSVVMPGDKSSTLPGHSDCWSGDSPFQVNFWIPLTRAFETNGMFILPEDKSFQIFEKIRSGYKFDEQSRPDMKYFVTTEPGYAVVFNPTLFHGSVENETNATRISLNVRVKNLFAPDFSASCPDRAQSSYYDVGNISDHSKLALRYMKLTKK